MFSKTHKDIHKRPSKNNADSGFPSMFTNLDYMHLHGKFALVNNKGISKQK
jgi:hypothetical protein